MIYLYFDGSTMENPGGPGGWAYVITDTAGSLLKADCGDLPAGPQCTVNTCEWNALLFGLVALGHETLRWDRVKVRGDSQLVVNQAKGKYKAKKAHLIVLADRAKELMSKLGRHRFEFEWLARDKNKLCDSLSRASTRPPSLPIGTWDLPTRYSEAVDKAVAEGCSVKQVSWGESTGWDKLKPEEPTPTLQEPITAPISAQGDLYSTCDSNKPKVKPTVQLAVKYLCDFVHIEEQIDGWHDLYWNLVTVVLDHIKREKR